MPPETRWPALMDSRQAAEYLSISTRQVSRYIADGTFDARTFSRRGVRITKVSLDAWIESLPSARTSKGRLERRPGPKTDRDAGEDPQANKTPSPPTDC